MITNWKLQSPDNTLWQPTVTTEGIVTFTSTSGTTPIQTLVTFPDTNGSEWIPSINDEGIIIIQSNATHIGDAALNHDRTRWAFSVVNNLVILTSSLLHRWELLPHARGVHS